LYGVECRWLLLWLLHCCSFIIYYLFNMILILLHLLLLLLHLLRYCPPNFIQSLAGSMDVAFYLPPDFIFFTQSMASRLYVLTSGEIELVNESTGERYALVVCRNVNAHHNTSDSGRGGGGGGGANTLGEAEFFQRSTYACSARVLQDTQCFEISFDIFWALVLEYKLEDVYKTQLELNTNKLRKMSTDFMVSALKGNLKNAKMAKLLSTVQHVDEAPNFFLLPNAPFCQFWTLISVCIIFFWAFTIPYYVAFENIGELIIFADVFSSVFFCIDIYFNMAYFAIEQDGDLITIASEFRKIYMEKSLALDLLSCIPVPLFVLGMTQNPLIYVILRWLHMLKLRKLSSKFHLLISFIEPLLRIRFPENVLRIVKTVVVVWYFGHVVCCFFFLVGREEEEGSSSSWLQANGVVEDSFLTKYLTCYLWAMYTVVTVGYGSVAVVSTGERLLAIVTMISGAILCDAGVAAVLSTMIDAQDRQSGVVKRQFDGVDAFCKNHSRIISPDLTKTMTRYFNYLSQSLGDHDELSDVSILPPVIWLEVVRRVSFR
jgi:CRP-like cAMP-binding protein